jgi:hypothetical protein
MKLKALPDVRGLGVGGVEYANDADGCINLPDEFVAVALEAGYTMPDAAPDAAPEIVLE